VLSNINNGHYGGAWRTLLFQLSGQGCFANYAVNNKCRFNLEIFYVGGICMCLDYLNVQNLTTLLTSVFGMSASKFGFLAKKRVFCLVC
jgi:hypothetical protein